jgi:hypothetical protein
MGIEPTARLRSIAVRCNVPDLTNLSRQLKRPLPIKNELKFVDLVIVVLLEKPKEKERHSLKRTDHSISIHARSLMEILAYRPAEILEKSWNRPPWQKSDSVG